MPSNKTNYDVINKLVFLSSEIKRRCESLSNSSHDDLLMKEKLFKICEKTRKNCEAFEVFLHDEKKNFNFSINLLDILGKEKCETLTVDNIDKFKEEVNKFIKNYWIDLNDPVYKGLSKIFNSPLDENPTVNLNATKDIQYTSREIFGTDSESSDNEESSKNTNGVANEAILDSNTNRETTFSNQQNGLPVTLDQTLENEANPSDENISGSDHSNETRNSPENLDIPKEKANDAININNLVVEQEAVENSSRASLTSTEIIPENSQKASDLQNNKNDDHFKEKSVTENSRRASEQQNIENDDHFKEKSVTENSQRAPDQHNIENDDHFKEKSVTENSQKPPEQQNIENDDHSEEKSLTENSQRAPEQQKIDNDDNFKEKSVSASSQEILDKDQVDEQSKKQPNCANEDESNSADTLKKKTSSEIHEELKNSNDNDTKKKEFLAFLELNKIPNYVSIRNMRDELMMMFSEEDCKNDSLFFKNSEESDDSKEDNSSDEKSIHDSDVAAALKELDEDSFLDSGSESELDLSSPELDTLFSDWDSAINKNAKPTLNKSNTSVSFFVPKKCCVNLLRNDLEEMQKELRRSNVSRQNSSMEDHNDKNGIQIEMKDCSVKLDPININKENSELGSDKPASEDAIINRLCQMPNFENNKRRREHVEKEQKRKIKRKRRSIELGSGSETTDLSDYKSVSEDEIKREVTFKDENCDNFPLDPNALLAEIVCHTIHDSDSDSSTIVSSEDEEDTSQQKKKDDNKTVTQSKEGESEKPKQKSSKDDPLLRCNLNLPSPLDKSKINRTKKRRLSFEKLAESSKILKTKLRRKYLDPDSSETDSSDDFEVSLKEKKENKDQSNEDSDIEYVPNTDNNNIINIDSDEETEKKTTSRKKILPVLSTRDLTEMTRKAAEEEKARIIRLEERKNLRSSSQESQELEVDSIILDSSPDGSKVVVDPNLTKKLFSHQVEGIKFMWDACYMSVGSIDTFDGTGCILAHNMGLGKTLQVVTLVHTLFNHPATKTKHVLIVCPLSTVSGWEREFLNALKIVQTKKDIKITAIESQYKSSKKCSRVEEWRKNEGVLILGYEAFTKLTKDDKPIKGMSMKEALVDPGPDLVVCDEGHLLKNGKALRTRALMEIKTKRRIALTGTPLQNNLNEYYYMVQFVKPNLLGNKIEFNRQFVNPIMNGQYENSQEYDITLMKKRTHVLNRLLENTIQRYEATELQKHLEVMNDYVLFIQVHPVQEKLYRKYIETMKKKTIANSVKKTQSFFVDYQILKYICSHPQLLQTMERQKAFEDKEVITQEPEVHGVEGLAQDWWKEDCPNVTEIVTNLEFGTKLKVMMGIIEEAEKLGEKVLIFTSSLVELSSVEFFLRLKGTPQCACWKAKKDYFRMDGTVSPSVRTAMCDMFNDESNKTLRVFLMSHKVGGLGLNLVAANRVILLGANFNPCLDTQSIYRVYRFGQKKPVYIYRLLSMGTMEEKMYNRCVNKLAVASRVVDKHQIARHYKNLDLEDLYNIEINLSLPRPTPVKPEDDILSNVLLRFDCVHKYHEHQKLLENRPDEELNEEDQKKAWEEFQRINEKEEGTNEKPPEAKIHDIVRNKWNQINMPPALKPISQSTTPVWKMTQTPKEKPTIRADTSLIQKRIQGYLNQPALRAFDQPVFRAPNQADGCKVPPNIALLPPKLIPISQKLLEARNRSKINNVSEKVKEPMNSRLQSENKKNAQNMNSNTNRKQNNKDPVHKSSAIGPNPLAKKENFSQFVKRKRWFSSSDFQGPSCSQWTQPSRKAPELQGPRKSTIDDDVIIVIDESESRLEPQGASNEIEEQLERLQQGDLTVTRTIYQKNKGNPPVIDITG